MKNKADAPLVKRAAKGDTQAFALLYKNVYEELYYYALANLGNEDDAADCVQDTALDAFTGIYLPYWTFDSETTSSYTAEYGKDYKDKDGNTKTRWYTTRGIYDEFIDDEVVYASTKTKDENIKSVSSFDFKKLRDYNPQFIAGFAAERYSLGLDDGWKAAQVSIQNKLKQHIGERVRSRTHADRVRNVRLSTSYDKITFKYLLAPIWISNFSFNGKVYNFVVNGQTGRIAGKSPVSALRVAIAIIIAIVVLCILGYVFGQ